MEKGQRFSRLVAIKTVGKKKTPGEKKSRDFWLFKCDCGNSVETRVDRVEYGGAKSCGCLQKESTKAGKSHYIHGLTNTKFHSTWSDMKRRTNNTGRKDYSRYGGKGIKYEERWELFIPFKEDMYASYKRHVNKYGEKNTTLERKDPKGNYSKENCTWATWKEQANNKIKETKYGRPKYAKGN